MAFPWGHKQLGMTKRLFHFQGLLPCSYLLKKVTLHVIVRQLDEGHLFV